MWVLPVSAESTGFPFAKSIIKARTVDLEDKSQSLTRYFISSLEASAPGAKRFAELVRGHWNIENGSHRQRDTLWRARMKGRRTIVAAAVPSMPRSTVTMAHTMTPTRSIFISAVSGEFRPQNPTQNIPRWSRPA